MKFTNLGFKWSEGKFYEKSSEQKEGFKEVRYTDRETKKEAITYHRLVDSITGKIHAVVSDQTSWGSKVLKVFINTGNDECTVLQVDLKNGYGYTEETKALLSSLRGYKKGEEVVINPKVTEFTRGNGRPGKSLNFYMNYTGILNAEGKGQSTGYINFSELPPLEKVEKRGEVSYNNDAQQDFYYEILTKILADFPKGVSSGNSNNSNTESSPSAEDKTSTKKADKPVADNTAQPKQEAAMIPNTKFDDDDLPF